MAQRLARVIVVGQRYWAGTYECSELRIATEFVPAINALERGSLAEAERALGIREREVVIPKKRRYQPRKEGGG